MEAICGIIRTETICNQEELLKRLEAGGFSITQATLSRDIKHLKVARVHDGDENYVYRLTGSYASQTNGKQAQATFNDIEFSGNLAVVKTRPGHAMAIAYEIDSNARQEILGTVAGDDTILVIPREGFTRESVAAAISRFLNKEL